MAQQEVHPTGRWCIGLPYKKRRVVVAAHSAEGQRRAVDTVSDLFGKEVDWSTPLHSAQRLHSFKICVECVLRSEAHWLCYESGIDPTAERVALAIEVRNAYHQRLAAVNLFLYIQGIAVVLPHYRDDERHQCHHYYPPQKQTGHASGTAYRTSAPSTR